MEKLVLIDGNSLLNRAFYAISPFNTRDGMPTNGIFGFVKLLFRIIADENPNYLVVAFDVHTPTFRHQLYDAYKATRRPMPEDLVVQVPALKELLSAMKIKTVELAGYEADDLIGTLSRAFEGVDTLIYTGDRDAYQLVKEHVSVCFTKRGVSETDRLTDENFYAKVGLTPAQIVEEKALMGDSSDNIPGVKGVGPKTALELLTRYKTAENVFAHLSELTPAMRKRFEGQEEIARLSHRLATIDTCVPLDVTLGECALTLPFPPEAREAFSRLEFRSLLGDPLLKGEGSPSPEAEVEIVVCRSLQEAEDAADAADEFALCFEEDGVHFYANGKEHILPPKTDLLGEGFFPETLKPFLSRLFTGGKRAYVADVKQLAHRLDGLGIRLSCPVEDVSLLCYLSDSNRRAMAPVGLAQDLGLDEKLCAYALFRTFEEGREKTAGTAEEKLYRDLELPLAHVLLDMENIGVRVDESKFAEFSEKYGKELSELSERIFAAAGKRFNLNSPHQLSEVLFDRLKLPRGSAKKNVHGGFSTSAEVLEKLAEEHEIVRLILRYREISKLQSTYVDGIRPLVSGGLVHTTYNQTMTTTGRLSSANPNLQNIPVRTDEGRELRKLFIAREGNVLIDADYSQIELRLLAHFSACKPLVEAYLSGKDIHAETAARVFGVSEVTPLLRRRAKAVNFGIIYGISAYGLSKDVGCSTGEAQAYIDGYFRTYPEVKEYMEENVRRAKADGYVTTILGRKRYIPELRSSNFATRSFGERAAMNMPLQGSSADIIKLAMLAVSRRLEREGLSSKLVLQVHDELVLDSPLGEAERAAQILKEEMEGAVSLSVPLTVEISSGRSWYDAK